MNKVILIGRMTNDPNLRYTPSGAAVCEFRLAVDRPFTNQNGEREADFINIVVWRKAAENCAKYLSKGRQTAVDGRLQIRTYDDNDGVRRWITEVVADHVEFLSSGHSNQNNGAQPPTGQYDGLGEEIAFDDMDIPF